MTTAERELSWSHGRFAILPTAGMLTWAEFDLGGQKFRPFARADWMGSVTDPAIVGHLRELGGEFVGVPFGSSPPPEGMTEDWRRCAGTLCNEISHGPSADRDWEIVSSGDGAACMRLDYDDDSPVARLERHVSDRDGSPALDFRLEIHARRPALVSVGLHPIFRLPETPGQLQIAADFRLGQTYPGLIPPGKTRALPNRDFTALSEVPAPGGAIDLGQLPPGGPVEDVLLLGGASGPAVLRYLRTGRR